MLDDTLFLVVGAAVLAVAGILVFGIATFAKGGEFNKRNANKIMRWRLAAQFIAVILILVFVYFRRQSGT